MSRLRVSRPSASVAIGVGLVAVAFVVVLVRFPSAISSFDARAAHNAAAQPADRTIAGADLLDISNPFLKAALTLVPPGAPYAVALPPSAAAASKLGIVKTTVDAFPGYAQFLLLPRRRVDPAQARWLLCYGCDLGPYRNRLDVRWNEEQGLVIGALRPQ